MAVLSSGLAAVRLAGGEGGAGGLMPSDVMFQELDGDADRDGDGDPL